MQNPRSPAQIEIKKPARVLVVGNPNAGKTSVFNAITGAQARVANYPGVTVSRYSQVITLPSGRWAEIIDTPGTYSLSARSPEELITVGEILGPEAPDVLICVVDAASLNRNLYLCLQLLETGLPMIIALTMFDTLRADTPSVDIEKLAQELSVPIVKIRAPKNEGKIPLLQALDQSLKNLPASKVPAVPYPAPVQDAVEELASIIEAYHPRTNENLSRAEALWALLTLEKNLAAKDVSAAAHEKALALQQQFAKSEQDLDHQIIEARYRWIEKVILHASQPPVSLLPARERIDRVLLHPVAGFAVFTVVMLMIFEALFTWSQPMMDGIDWLISFAQTSLQHAMPPGVLRELLSEGIIAGVGNVLVFVPQIFLLFLFIGFLEDCGYLARVAFVIDRVMRGVGLHGKAFVPLLSGFACAVPAVMATRTIEQRRDRLATMLALPLMSCSARLPVYILVTGTVFGSAAKIAGVFTPGTLALLSMYALSVTATLLAATILRRTALRGGPQSTFLLELPAYHWPNARNLWLHAWRGLKSFLTGAGTVIVALTILLWVLFSFPKNADVTRTYAHMRQQVRTQTASVERDEKLKQLSGEEASEQIGYSLAGRAGKFLEPVFEPLGFDWRIGVAIIASFAAREVFVSTLGIVFGIEEGDATSVPLRKELATATWPSGKALITPLSGLSLMVFFVFACQCMSTIAAVKRESGSWRWPLFMFAYMSLLAYGSSALIFQLGKAWGFG